MKKLFAMVMSAILITAAGCAQQTAGSSAETTAATTGATTAATTAATTPAVTNLNKPDMARWQYNAEYDLYYQIGIDYCEKPADTHYEQLSVFVPAAYVSAKANGDGTYTCEMNENAEINGYTAANAPIVMPVFTEGYAAAQALTEDFLNGYKGFTEALSAYTAQGFVYVYAGCRGIDEGAPLGVADLKAAVRYVRYSDDVLPGNAENIFAFGMSAGGALASVLGASGNSPLYTPYLDAIGAVQGVSDAVAGVMAWCPVTDLDTANAAYEWMMGCSRQGRSEEWNKISDKLAAAYADYVNSAGFTDEDGKPLTLESSQSGIYQAGSYYEYIKSVIERSLNNYLSDAKLTGSAAQDYINGLNADKKWITYDQSTNTATVTSVEDFVKACKNASELPVAFDWPGSGNTLFGKSNGRGAHFDKILSGVLTELNSEYAAEYAADMNITDSLGTSVEQRVKMYAPLYYVLKSSEGYGTSAVAKHWRIRSGIEQPTTSLTTEVNMALALQHCDGVESVDFETVWELSHDKAEREGDSTENFILWVKQCAKG